MSEPALKPKEPELTLVTTLHPPLALVDEHTQPSPFALEVSDNHRTEQSLLYRELLVLVAIGVFVALRALILV